MFQRTPPTRSQLLPDLTRSNKRRTNNDDDNGGGVGRRGSHGARVHRERELRARAWSEVGVVERRQVAGPSWQKRQEERLEGKGWGLGLA